MAPDDELRLKAVEKAHAEFQADVNKKFCEHAAKIAQLDRLARSIMPHNQKRMTFKDSESRNIKYHEKSR